MHLFCTTPIRRVCVLRRAAAVRLRRFFLSTRRAAAPVDCSMGESIENGLAGRASGQLTKASCRLCLQERRLAASTMSGHAGVCAYYNAPGGCSRGSRCTFKHEGQEGVGIAVRPIIAAAVVDRKAVRKEPAAPSANAQLLRLAPVAPVVQHFNNDAASTIDFHSDPALSVASSVPAASGTWTRGAPHKPRPAFIPAASKPLMQLQAQTPELPRPAAASVDSSTWNTVQRARPASAAAAASSAGATSAVASPAPAAAPAAHPRGMLNLPKGTVLHPTSSSSQVAPSAKASNPNQNPKKPRPHAVWSLADRLDLSSLKKLDALTAVRPVHTSLDATNQFNFPALPTTAAWATASSAAKKSVSALKQPTATAASSSSARPSHSASHKSTSKVSFSTAASASSSSAAPRPRSASVKSKRKIPTEPHQPKKKPKQTALKKALIKERVHAWCKEIVTNLLRAAVGDAPLEVVSEPTRKEREQQLAELTRKVKKATYDAKQADLAVERENAREEKLRLKEQKRMQHEQQQEQQRRAKEEKRLEREEQLRKMKEDQRFERERPQEEIQQQVRENRTQQSSLLRLEEVRPAEAAVPSARPIRRLMSPLLPPSSIFNQDFQPASSSSLPNASSLIERIDATSAVDPPSELTNPQQPSFDVSAEHDQDDSDGASSDAASEENDVEAPAAKEDEDPENVFVAAPALPSAHLVAHFPSATPPVVSSAPSAASSSTHESGVHMLRSLAIPSSLKLSPAEQALLNWHFQSQHHGLQPRLVGAVKRHCKQMWRKEIDSRVEAMLKELHRLDARAKERDPLKAAQKRRYVSGLKQVWKLLRVTKIKCVLVPANIEANEAAGGLDDLLDDILGQCYEQHVPIVFTMTRVKLGKALGLKNTASCVGLLDYSGCGDDYKQLLNLVKEAQEEWSMFQCDTWLNPRPADYEEQVRRDEEILETKRKERERKKEQHEKQVSLAEAQRREYELAQRTGADGAARKKKSRPERSGRELQPLPVFNEEEAKGKRRKGRRGKKSDVADLPSSSSSTAAQLKGAGKALSAIAEAMAEPDDEKGKKPTAAAVSGKSNKKGKSDKKASKGKSNK
jgi:ribosomal protein L7Ae-like RNA K-turn-binding protein